MDHLDQATGTATLCQRLGQRGSSFAAISPGSRSAPLALALASNTSFHSVSVIDERMAGFIALGASKHSGAPELVVTTSGTAAANLAPAVHEAHEARVPLIALTADRPPELRHVGEGQTIDQVRLFGSAAHYLELDHGGTASEWIALADAAFDAATGPRPGPVQINLSLRPPLNITAPAVEGSPWSEATSTSRTELQTANANRAADLLERSQRPLFVAGRDERGRGAQFATLADQLNVPLLADPLSGAAAGRTAVSHWDSILRCSDWADAANPDLIVRSGDMPTSKPLRNWLTSAAATAEVIEFDSEAAERDPLGITTLKCEIKPQEALAAASAQAAESSWLKLWQVASSSAEAAVTAAIDLHQLTEPAIARTVIGCLDSAETVFVSASMPIRDVESFAVCATDSPRIVANRGANGIDGVVSTAVGFAMSSGTRTAVLIGDVAFAHDQAALMLLRSHQANVVVVVIDNGAGTIFDSLPIAADGGELFERFFATPTNLPLAALAHAWNVNYVAPRSVDELGSLLRNASGPLLVHLTTERIGAHKTRQTLHSAVAEALSA